MIGEARRKNAGLRALTKDQRAQVALEREATRRQIQLLMAQAKADLKTAKAQTLLLPAQAAAQTSVQDSESTGKLVRALPWVLGAVAVVGVVYFMRRKAVR